MNNLISKSQDLSTEYCATVVRVGEVKPIENSDFLGTVMIEGRDIVVRKDAVHEGDVMIYVSNECQLDYNFLHSNNEFEDVELNANYEEVTGVTTQMQYDGATPEQIKEYIQQHKGYFDKRCRVRMKKLRGVMSMGYLIRPEQMETYMPVLKDFDWENHVEEDFDTVNDVLFVKAYVPEVKEPRNAKKGRYEKRVKKFNRMIPGQFAFHYDTQQLNRCMNRIKPSDSVSITVKEHGTSAIFGNVKVKMPRWGGWYTRIFNYLPEFLRFTKNQYDTVYSSRSVIKNATLNPSVTDGFYGTDVWNEYYQILKKYIPEGVTIYGEIVGYVTGTTKGIQSMGGKVYDYGCKPGENRLMIYRVKKTNEDGTVIEANVGDVLIFTNNLIKMIAADDKINMTNNAGRIKPIVILHNGPLTELYPDVPQDEHWHENVLGLMKQEHRFGMEENEPLCKNKLPREGIVLRINGDPVAEAFKLKCLKFLGKEAEEMDKGEVNDIEMEERY